MSCLRTQRSAPAEARTRIARFGVRRTNHLATAPPTTRVRHHFAMDSAKLIGNYFANTPYSSCKKVFFGYKLITEHFISVLFKSKGEANSENVLQRVYIKILNEVDHQIIFLSAYIWSKVDRILRDAPSLDLFKQKIRRLHISWSSRKHRLLCFMQASLPKIEDVLSTRYLLVSLKEKPRRLG